VFRRCRATAALTLMLALAVACDFPRDAEGTLARVRGGTMRVGVSQHAPWVRLASEEPEGVEPALLRRWAKQLEARLEWVRGSEAALVEALQQGAIDVLAAGLQHSTPFASKMALSQPYLTTRIHFAVPPGATLPGEWAGRSAAVPPDRLTIVAAVLQAGAMPVAAADLWRGSPLVAAYDFEIEAYDMQRAGSALAVERRVIATRPGESAFLLALDRFLQGLDEAEVRRLAAAEAVP
jgi:polar amino acid transport system substrate-binding protein